MFKTPSKSTNLFFFNIILPFELLAVLVVINASIANHQKMNQTYLEKFAKNLKKIRAEKHLTQDDIAMNGVSRSMISLLELARTDVTITKLKIIADNLGVEIKDLFDFEHTLLSKDELIHLINNQLIVLDTNKLQYIYKSVQNIQEL